MGGGTGGGAAPPAPIGGGGSGTPGALGARGGTGGGGGGADDVCLPCTATDSAGAALAYPSGEPKDTSLSRGYLDYVLLSPPPA